MALKITDLEMPVSISSFVRLFDMFDGEARLESAEVDGSRLERRGWLTWIRVCKEHRLGMM